jgi:hypothetical protein
MGRGNQCALMVSYFEDGVLTVMVPVGLVPWLTPWCGAGPCCERFPGGAEGPFEGEGGEGGGGGWGG